MNEKFYILIKFSLEFVPKGPIDNKSVLDQVMAWSRTGDKPLPELILTLFTDTYRKVSNIRRTLVGEELQLHLHSQLNTWLQWIGPRQLQDETRNIYVWRLGAPYIRDLTV